MSLLIQVLKWKKKIIGWRNKSIRRRRENRCCQGYDVKEPNHL